MKMQDFMQKIKEKKLKRSDWLILVLAGILILIIALPTDTKEKKGQYATNIGWRLDAFGRIRDAEG